MCFRPAAVSLTNTCPQCGAECALDLETCPECGEKLPDVPSMPGAPGAPGHAVGPRHAVRARRPRRACGPEGSRRPRRAAGPGWRRASLGKLSASRCLVPRRRLP